MVADLSAWIKNIILIVLFATFLELLLPHSHMRSFVRVIMGLFIMISILQPILNVMENHSLQAQVPVMSVDSGKATGIRSGTQQTVANREQLVREIYCRDLAKQISATVSSIDGVAETQTKISLLENKGPVLARDATIDRIAIYIRPGVKQDRAIGKVTIQKPVADTNLDPVLQHKVKKMITELYQVPGDKITINLMIQGGSP